MIIFRNGANGASRANETNRAKGANRGMWSDRAGRSARWVPSKRLPERYFSRIPESLRKWLRNYA
jgi:hypothetical protein